MQINKLCPACGKPIRIIAEKPVVGLGFVLDYKCGHKGFSQTKTDFTVLEAPEVIVTDILDATGKKSLDPRYQALDGSGFCLHQYQIEGIQFIEAANFRGIIGDEVGVGKTPQALGILRNHPELLPAVIIVKPATTYNWLREAHRWFAPVSGDGRKNIMPVLSRNHIIPGLDLYIMGHELLQTGNKDKGGSAVDRLLKCGIKTIIVDEAHCFKNGNASRTEALITLIMRGSIQNRIFLSGTAIVNRAPEYFTMLNLCDPAKFTNFPQFCRDWLIVNEKGYYSRIKPWRLDEFHKLTGKYIIRRTRKEVLKDLPAFNHQIEVIQITDPEFKKLYNKQLDLFSNFLNADHERMNATEILGYLTRLRNITGMAKINPTTEMVRDFLDNTENPDEKLIIGIHHKDVSMILATNLLDYGVLTLDGSHGTIQKDKIINEFRDNPKKRILIANVLSGGVGLNLQFCQNIWLMERQWSPSHEKQFWGRVDRQGQTLPVFAKTLNGDGTLDHLLDQINAEKQIILSETLDNDTIEFTSGSLRDLADRVIAHRLN